MNRRITLILSMSLAVLWTACSVEEDYIGEEPQGVELTVTASLPGESDTKTILQDSEVYWTPGDAINLFFGNQSSGQFTSNLVNPSATAEFSGTLTVATGSTELGSTGKSFWGVYPYDENNTCDGNSVTLTIPSIQASLAGSFADKLNPAVATSPGVDLAFYNVCAPFYFSVTQTGVTSVTFRGNNNEDVAGRVQVTMDSNGKPVADVVENQGVKSITINAPEGGFVPGTTYVLILIPQTLSSGYTLTLNRRFRTASCVVSKNSEFIRAVGRSKYNADEGLTYVAPIPDAIDLGLSVKWGSFNIGASEPAEYGEYYAWGETEPKSEYSWSTYIWCNGTNNTLTKYVGSSSYGTVDNKTELDLEDEVAKVILGGSWRLPTYQECNELATNCTWVWTDNYEGTGVAGYIATSKVTGHTDKSIFLPAAGRCNSTLFQTGLVGHYWSSTVYLGSNHLNDYAMGLEFTSSGSPSANFRERCQGLSVRPVSE